MNDDDAFWIHDADPAVDICDSSLTADACLATIVPELNQHVDLSAAPRIVEIGCGIGRLTVPLQQMIPEATVIGTDITERFLAAADDTPEWPRPVHLLTDTLGVFPEGSIDAVYTMCVLQHLDNERKRAYVEGAARILRPGGVMVAQFVEGDHAGRCMYDVPTGEFTGWCASAGLDVVHVRGELLMPRWTWVTAVKPK